MVTQTGKSYGANDFSEIFPSWCEASDLPRHCVFHGLRKAALTRLADAGCTVHELAAISGHKTGQRGLAQPVKDAVPRQVGGFAP